MTYLTRPVFDFAIDWGNPVNKQFAYDLEEVAIGFGSEIFSGLQSHTVQGYEVALLLRNWMEIESFDSFIEALTGRLQGFWFPAPLAACKWKSAVNSTHFDILAQGLADTWADHPDIYLWFGTATPQIRRITAVTAVTGGERITLDSALSVQPNAGTPIRRLHYVRLAGDDEAGEFLSEGIQRRALKVVELPLEYTAYELGTQPIYLYKIWMDAPATTYWRYTSFAADVVSGNELFTRFAINHGSLKSSAKPQDQTLDVEAAYDPSHPFVLFLPIAPQRPMNIEVSQVSYSDPDSATLLFSGQVRKVEDAGASLKATCDNWWNILQRKTPRLFMQPDCNYDLFERNTCRVTRAKFETTAGIVSLAPDVYPPTVTIDMLHTGLTNRLAKWITQDWFANGFIETGYGTQYECRTIISSVLDTAPNRIKLELNAPLFHAETGQWLQIIAGCDGKCATCSVKFRNFDNFGGFPDIPTRNPALKAMNTTTAQGGKK